MMRGHTMCSVLAGVLVLSTALLQAPAAPASPGAPSQGIGPALRAESAANPAQGRGTAGPGRGALYLCERMYEWTDAGGQVHMTNEPGDIPASAQGRVKALDLPDAAPGSPGVPAESVPAGAAEGAPPGADAGPAGQGTDCRRQAQAEIQQLQAQLDHDREAAQALRQQIVFSPYVAVQDRYRQQLAPVMERMEKTRKALDEATAREAQCP